ncbi:hypothetical protein A9Q84_06400 [Halobacteriovorax marinus]|uniref:Uncharacterized protein n=1 Tax=Halobacteriovorax marinus TaxID=97084 RepID=A0A1Y5F9M5_9BACT|nr:hypothetical protein A9Q84_06400 [Halobacteriovorax marinus]
MKLLKIMAFIFALSIPVYFGLKLLSPPEDQQANWDTYEKKDKKITTHKSTKTEKKKSRVSSSKRAPASKAPVKKTIGPSKRILTGSLRSKYENSPWDLSYVNTPSIEWKNLYANKMLTILPEGTKVLIKKTQGVIIITAKGAKYVEHVRVSIQKEDAPPVGFEAQVDSESGQQLKVWNRTHFEYGQGFSFKKKLQ